MFGGEVLFQVISVVMGVAFGMALLNSPLALVLYFALPTGWSVLVRLVPALRAPAGWLDLDATMAPLVSNALTGEAWARLVTSVAVWVLLPLGLGLARLLRGEVK